VCLDAVRPRRVAAALLLAVALASSSFGLPFGIAAAALAAERRDRRAIGWLAIVWLAYATWYALYHFTGPLLCTIPTASELAVRGGPFALAGLAYGVGAPLGIGTALQPIVPVAAGLAALWVIAIVSAVRARREAGLAVATLAGILAMGVLVAWGRGCLGPQITGASRYVYVTGFLVLVGVGATPAAGAVGRLAAGIRPAFVGVLLAAALALNLRALAIGHDSFAYGSAITRAAVQVAFGPGGDQCHSNPVQVDMLTAGMAMLPPPARLRELVGAPGALDPPAWEKATPDPALAEEVRHAMCDVPPVAAP
jgi:hypothetical protein